MMDQIEPFTLALPEGDMAGYRWSRPGAPRILFAHANGFNARTYRQMLEPVAQRFEVVALDLRGHGRSRLPVDPSETAAWEVHARDLARAIEALGDRALILAGHSMGGSALVLAGTLTNVRPLGYVLIEPAILPDLLRFATNTPLAGLVSRHTPIVRNAKNRFDGWDTVEAVFERYRAKAMFSRWADGVLEDYLADGLVKGADGRWHLACPPAWEAANFATQRHRIMRAVRSIAEPIALLKAGRGSTVYPVAALERAGVQIDRAEQHGHLLAMDDPGFTAGWLIAQATRLAGRRGT
ncbi:alpha/beta fold hydrolase [Marinicauda algicola]|uniref:Alpha/beta fold hydrolase n=1 Tax=Marinicauda algicola TaxID=2029849 RepID=A0A4S2GY44_9PROT|nr:alpha/beta hydrolase [Marinicauda algicola]TGY87801.1 alpha/beta fold hydrolase [Marinicauda algicola]